MMPPRACFIAQPPLTGNTWSTMQAAMSLQR
jgi:hypothetical protein